MEGGTGGKEWVGVDGGARTTIVTQCGESDAFNSFNLQMGGGRKKKLDQYSSSASNCHFSVLSLSSLARSLVSFLLCLLFSCSVSLFTAGLGYSFRRQAHFVSLLLRVIERERERKRERRKGGGEEKWGGQKTENKWVPQLCRRKKEEGGK